MTTDAAVEPTEDEQAEALSVSEDPETQMRVAALLARRRAHCDRAWAVRMARITSTFNELRAARDRAEQACARVREAATAVDYLPPYRRVPRFVMPGKEVLRALGEP